MEEKEENNSTTFAELHTSVTSHAENENKCSEPSKKSNTKVFPRRRRSSEISFVESTAIDNDNLSVSSLESQKLDNDNDNDDSESSSSNEVIEVKKPGENKVEFVPPMLKASSISSLYSKGSNTDRSVCSWSLIKVNPSPKFLLIGLCCISVISILLYIFIFYSMSINMYGEQLFNTIYSIKHNPKSRHLSHLDHLSDILNTKTVEKDLPFLWNTPLKVDVNILNIFGTCYHLTQASTFNGRNYIKNAPLYVVKVNGMNFVNVNLNDKADIQRAIDLKLADSNLAEIYISPHLYQMANVFTHEHKGRMLVLLKHPIERSLEIYYNNLLNLVNSTTPKTNLTQALWQSLFFEYDNWLTRNLNNVLDSSTKLTSIHLDTAKEILRNKFLVGKVDDIENSMHRFKTYFDWNAEGRQDSSCENFFFNKIKLSNEDTKRMKNNYMIDKEDLDIIYSMNNFDLELYKYASDLYTVQGKLLFGDNGIAFNKQK